MSGSIDTTIRWKVRSHTGIVWMNLGVRIAELVKAKGAIMMSNMFTFDNSLAKGRKMSSDLGKLMLRAYNAEVDNSLRSLRAGNVLTAKKRVESARTAIAKLGQMMEMHISDAFHDLRIEEIEADFRLSDEEARGEGSRPRRTGTSPGREEGRGRTCGGTRTA